MKIKKNEVGKILKKLKSMSNEKFMKLFKKSKKGYYTNVLTDLSEFSKYLNQ